MDTVLILAVVLVLLALAALWSSGRQRKAAGMPDGRVVAADTNGWKRMEKPLYDQETGLTGRPDYVIDMDGMMIPVEVKSSWAPPEPHDSHLFQLAAYCLLIEQYSGVRPTHGILHYRNRTFEIDYTRELEGQLRGLLDEIRGQRGSVNRSHNEPGRCEHCGFRGVCDQKL
jgi:CRISPR-associated exonuclease Cas4